MYYGYGYESRAQLTEVPGTGMEVLQNSHKFRVGTRMLYPTRTGTRVFYKGIRLASRVQCHGRTELTEVSGTGMNVVQNFQKLRYAYYQGKYPGYGSVRTLQNSTLSITVLPV